MTLCDKSSSFKLDNPRTADGNDDRALNETVRCSRLPDSLFNSDGGRRLS